MLGLDVRFLPEAAPQGAGARSYKAIYDQHLVANVLDQTGNSAYLGDFDMSSPDVIWTCEQVTIPP